MVQERIDCAAETSKLLYITIYKEDDGKPGDSFAYDLPPKPIVPDSFGAFLLEEVCWASSKTAKKKN
jgi:hypothetical protein